MNSNFVARGREAQDARTLFLRRCDGERLSALVPKLPLLLLCRGLSAFSLFRCVSLLAGSRIGRTYTRPAAFFFQLETAITLFHTRPPA